MQNYRLRILSEKLTTLIAQQQVAEAACSAADDEIVAARRQLRFRTQIERQAQGSEDARFIQACEDLLKEYPSRPTLLENFRLARRKREASGRALSATLRFISETKKKVEQQLRLIALIQSKYSNALEQFYDEIGNVEVICKIKPNRNELHIYYGGEGNPIGDGHAHWVYRHNKFVVRRPPRVMQVA